MNELSLFTGAGGGVLGSKLLGWRTVAYVEWEPYCQDVISRRIADGIFDEGPIFGDIDEFVESGAAKKFAGYIDVVTAGFPCSPFSNAGKQKHEDDPRNKWPQTLQCLRDIRPRYALMENVVGLLSSGYFPTILADLAQEGFDVEWVVLGADDVGAPHHRKRLFFLAHSEVERVEGLRAGGEQKPLAYGSEVLPVREGERPESTYWEIEPELGRVVDGLAHRSDRLRALGNGQVPLVVASAWQILNGAINERQH